MVASSLVRRRWRRRGAAPRPPGPARIPRAATWAPKAPIVNAFGAQAATRPRSVLSCPHILGSIQDGRRSSTPRELCRSPSMPEPRRSRQTPEPSAHATRPKRGAGLAPPAALERDALEHVRDRLARVDRRLERLEDVLPADHDHRIDAV